MRIFKKSKKKIYCWVDHLNFFSFGKLLALKFKFDLGKVYYLKENKLILDFIRFFQRWLFEVQPIKSSRRYIIVEDQMAAILNGLFDKGSEHLRSANFSDLVRTSLAGADQRLDKEKLELFCYQELSFDFEIPIKLIDCARLYISQNIQEINDTPLEHVILFRDTYWISDFREHYKKHPFSLETYPYLKSLIGLFYFPIKIFLELIYNSLLIWFGKAIKEPENNRPKIAVLYTQGANLDKKCDYFWFRGSRILGSDVIVYFKHHLRPPSQDILAQIKENGLAYFDLLPRRLSLKPLSLCGELNHFPTKFYQKRLLQLCRDLPYFLKSILRSNSKKTRWINAKLIQLFNDVSLFEAFFAHFIVCIHYGAYAYGRHMMASNLAINLVGGADLIHHWSDYDQVDIFMGSPHDVFFAWGPFYKKGFLEKPYYLVQNFVYTGYIYDFTINLYQQNARLLRQKLFGAGARFIVAFFDSQLSEGEMSFFNEEQEKLYRYLLTKIIEDRQFGLILKSKRTRTLEDFRKSYPQLSDLFQDAVSTGRCLILPIKTFLTEASQAADLALGAGICSTTMIEAQLAGIPAIVYNAEQRTDHPLFQEGHHKIIFTDFQELVGVIEGFQAKQPKKGWGDYSFVMHRIDPFRDQKAYQRVGSYLYNLYAGFLNGQSKHEAIHQANRLYRQAHGIENVMDSLTADADLPLQEETTKYELLNNG